MNAPSAREIIVYLHKPGAKFFQLAMELRDVPGALADVSSLLAKNGLNILGGFISGSKTPESPEGERSCRVGLFVEGGGEGAESASLGRVTTMVESCPYVSRVRARESRNGVIIDSLNYPINLGDGQRAILIRKEVMSASMAEIRQVFSSGGDVMLFKQGLAAGQADAVELIKTFGRDHILEMLDELVNLYSAIGWGRARIERLDISKLSAVVRIEDNFECVGRKTAKPYSQFVRGHLTGLTSALLSVDIRCTEVRCSAVGAPYCEFFLSIE